MSGSGLGLMLTVLLPLAGTTLPMEFLVGEDTRWLATLEANFLGAGLLLVEAVDPLVSELLGLVLPLGLTMESSVAWFHAFRFMTASTSFALAPGPFMLPQLVISPSTLSLTPGPSAACALFSPRLAFRGWVDCRGKCGMRWDPSSGQVE